jgi:hypothetical protein
MVGVEDTVGLWVLRGRAFQPFAIQAFDPDFGKFLSSSLQRLAPKTPDSQMRSILTSSRFNLQNQFASLAFTYTSRLIASIH